MLIILTQVSPFLPPLSTAQTIRVEAWLPAISVLLTARYGQRVTPEVESIFFSTTADALERRLSRSAELIEQQSIGPASVRYSSKANLSQWFLPEELAQMDAVVGTGGTHSVRMPTADAIRYGNLAGITEDYF